MRQPSSGALTRWRHLSRFLGPGLCAPPAVAWSVFVVRDRHGRHMSPFWAPDSRGQRLARRHRVFFSPPLALLSRPHGVRSRIARQRPLMGWSFRSRSWRVRAGILRSRCEGRSPGRVFLGAHAGRAPVPRARGIVSLVVGVGLPGIVGHCSRWITSGFTTVSLLSCHVYQAIYFWREKGSGGLVIAQVTKFSADTSIPLERVPCRNGSFTAGRVEVPPTTRDLDGPQYSYIS